jgi:hypothetical protein
MRVVVTIYRAMVLGLVFTMLHSFRTFDIRSVAAALLWAQASMAAGAAVGFLFGIPRVLQDDDREQLAADAKAEQRPRRGYRQLVNTNLEQISDWLTKIIVGIGLVELRRIPTHVARVGRRIAVDIGDQEGQMVGVALLLDFGTLGFLAGYLITRLMLAGLFRAADEDAIRAAVERVMRSPKVLEAIRKVATSPLPATEQQPHPASTEQQIAPNASSG